MKKPKVSIEPLSQPVPDQPVPDQKPIDTGVLTFEKPKENGSIASTAAEVNNTTLNNDFATKFSSGYTDAPKIPPIEEARRRGRKPGSKTKVPPQEFKPQESKPLFVGSIMSGAIFLTIVDIFFPIIIAGINNKFNKKKIKFQDLKLEASVRKELEPLCNEVLKTMNVQMHPGWALVMSMFSMYSMAWVNAINKSETKKPEQPKPV